LLGLKPAMSKIKEMEEFNGNWCKCMLIDKITWEVNCEIDIRVVHVCVMLFGLLRNMVL
jgi:hypothetical protein